MPGLESVKAMEEVEAEYKSIGRFVDRDKLTRFVLCLVPGP